MTAKASLLISKWKKFQIFSTIFFLNFLAKSEDLLQMNKTGNERFLPSIIDLTLTITQNGHKRELVENEKKNSVCPAKLSL